MERSGYIDDYDDDNWAHICWRGQVSSSIRGKRGQAFLRELIETLDAMPEKRLIAGDLKSTYGVCAMGSVGVRRGLPVETLDPEDYDAIARIFGIAAPLVRELEYVNDDGGWNPTPEKRWGIVRDWAQRQLKDSSSAKPAVDAASRDEKKP